MKIRLVSKIVFVLALFSAMLLHAQDSASVTGTVRDSSGASVANAQVTVSAADRGINRETTTNSDGEFSVPALPPGSYDITISAQGFKKFEVKALVLRVAQKARTDVTLQIGAAATEVTVLGADIAQVETQSSDLTGTVTGKEITQLQLNGRNFTQLVTLVPGVSNQTGQDEGTVGVYGNVSFSINGGRVEYNNWELDGGDNMDNGSNDTLNVYPSLEAIAEFKVLTSNYGAQYGRNGSGTVEVETKSGTNSFHGNAYEFVRNDAFNARNFFQTSVPPYKKNDYGYTIGGPVYIPGVYNKSKNKTFFFWSQEWRKDRVPGQDFNVQVPSLEERAGNFSDQCPDGFCPVVNGNPTPDLTTVGFNPNDPNVQALLALIPEPNSGSGASSFFVASPTSPTNWREELIRIDHNLTDKHRLTFRYIHDSWDTVTAVPLWTNAGSFPTIQTAFKGPGVSLVTRLSSTFTPTLLNEFVFSYTTDHIVLNDTGAWQRPAGMTIGDLFGGNGNGIIPGINLVGDSYGGGFGEDPGYIPNGIYNSNPTYTYRDNISKIIGRHNLQFGAYAAFGQKNEFGGELGAGSIPGYLTFDSSKGVSTTNPFADLLLGYISSFGQQDRFVKYYNRYKIVEPYFQDDWHITNRLTLNLGLRLSLFGTYREKQKQAFNFDPARYAFGQTTVDPQTGIVTGLGTDPTQPVSLTNLPNGIVQCGVTSGVPVSCMKGHLFNPAPRVGFAWDPRGNGKTAIRGGYGIFFEHANGNEGNTESLENSPPLANAVSQPNIVGPPGPSGAPTSGYPLIGVAVGPSPQFPLNVNAIPTKARWPYIQQWHFDVQQEIIKNTVATVSYVGSKGTHLNRQTNFNQIHAVPLSDNPYKVGEAIGPDDCNTFTTPSGVVITSTTPGFVNMEVTCGLDPSGNNFDSNSVRPFLGYGDINHLEYAASSVYHAFQTSVRRNLGGLNVSFAYTWSHSIDDSSDRFDGSFVDSYNPASNRASSNFDQRHILTFSYVWDLPFFKSPGLTHKVLGGWQYSGITTFQTGTPFSAVMSSDNAGVANGLGSSSRPDLVGDPNAPFPQIPLENFGPQFYNAAAFAPARGLTFGTSPRNLLRNPHRINFDMSLFKHFAITESVGFEFRAEAYNIFNHTQWNGIAGDSGSAGGAGNNTLGSDGFLYVSQAHNPRILQLGAKFIF